MAFSLLSVGARALSANYAALQTTGHNIANASVQGYSRQQANLETALAQRGASGFLGSGVDVTGITRAHNGFLSREALNTGSQAALDSKHVELLSQMESVFAPGEAGVGHAASQLFGAMSDLASAPNDMAVRQVVLSRAGELAQRFSNAGQALDSMQSGVVSELGTAATAVNGLTHSIAELNAQIVKQQAQGQSPNDLLDKRDQAVQQLGSYLQVSTMAGKDGSIAVFAAGGQSLVLDSGAQTLEVAPDSLDPSRAGLTLRNGAGNALALDSASLTGGGSIGAMLRFQNQDLVAARNTLGQMAMALSAGMNAQQAQGVDLGTPPAAGKALFTDFVQASQNGMLRGQPAANNSPVPSGPPPSVSMKITNASLLEADEYTLSRESSSGYVMTRRSDGQRFTTPDGSSFSYEGAAGPGAQFDPGFTLTLGGSTMATGDRFLLQPVGTAASRLQVALNDPRGIAAAAPTPTATPGPNTGGAVAKSPAYTGTGLDTAKAVQGTLTFTDGSGAYQYDWKQLDASGKTVSTGSLVGTFSSGQTLRLQGLNMNLDTSGGLPAAGDSFTLQAGPHAGQSNGNALAFTALSDQALVGRRYTAAAGSSGGATMTDAWANALSGVGSQVQTAKTASDISSGVASDALAARDAQSGVSLDEEAARLIQFQQSYQAAAKVLQVAQSVFDSLLQATSR